MAPRVPVEDFSDDEWIAVMRHIPPDAGVSIAELAVAEMRGARRSCPECRGSGYDAPSIPCHNCGGSGIESS